MLKSGGARKGRAESLSCVRLLGPIDGGVATKGRTEFCGRPSKLSVSVSAPRVLGGGGSVSARLGNVIESGASSSEDGSGIDKSGASSSTGSFFGESGAASSWIRGTRGREGRSI